MTAADRRPQRIQRKRTKGWKMPEGAVYVGRPTWFGNPFRPRDYWDAGYSGDLSVATSACVFAFREWLTRDRTFSLDWRQIETWLYATRNGRIERLPELRGKDLVCWCPLDQPCHADVLLELANREER